jgi:hypothetical protein
MVGLHIRHYVGGWVHPKVSLVTVDKRKFPSGNIKLFSQADSVYQPKYAFSSDTLKRFWKDETPRNYLRFSI